MKPLKRKVGGGRGQRQMALALQHHQAGRLQEAERLYRQILAKEPKHADALHMLGALAQQHGQPQEAKRLIGMALAIHPQLQEAHFNLGVTLVGLGDHAGAEASYKAALALNRDYVLAWSALGELYTSVGALEPARDVYLEVIRRQPGDLVALGSLGTLLQTLGDFHGAVEMLQRALALEPSNPVTHYNCGNALMHLKRLEEALGHFQRAIDLAPTLVEAHNNYGLVLWELERLPEAEAAYRQALALAPQDASLHNNLGAVLTDRRLFDEALIHARRALELHPDYAEAHSNLGNILRERGDFEEAVAHHERALALEPGFAKAHNNLGNALRELGRLQEAEAQCRRALELDPDYAGARCNLGSALRDQSRLNEARAEYEAALRLKPEFGMVKNLVTTLLNLPGVTADELYESIRRHVGAALPQGIRPLAAVPVGALPKRLRVGYLSADFRSHPAGHNIMPLLTHHDPERVELFCYSSLAGAPDETTRHFQQVAHHWRSTVGMGDQQIAELIHSDAIDVMVYVAGYFDSNRELAAAWRPAPVQVSFHNGTSSGLDQMDYWLTDGFLHPEGATRERFSETLYRLPVFYNYPEVVDAPEPAGPPLEHQGFVTFGSFNNPAKFSDAVFALWAELLKAMPTARLMLKYRHYLGDRGLRKRVLDAFAAHGVGEERLLLPSAKDDFPTHMALYHKMDIALDPFPFNGATTTFQALWMGVPVVTLAGHSFISRAAGSMVRLVTPDLVVENSDDYINCARRLASDIPRLKALRGSLRASLLDSPLCDPTGYARSVEYAFREMWRQRAAGTS